ncbi:probable glucan endo-1,3-beta-glucosidase A6 [Neltuma alba]|uniref:probable glucan endo-1,3-beta-glucosidase A6 n=1 Tax=Neltuma alba TaxID=207710 RepID=UPI0010A3F5A8|nr:probable glucan endo-1,3-beta-glucosidase A6 [Prosopis alba]
MDVLAISLFSLLSISKAEISTKIGVNYGRVGNNLPSPAQSIELLTTMKAGRVKLYDANPEILNLLSETKFEVSVMVHNSEISSIASNQSISDEWVRQNVLPYYPKTLIRFLPVGNEVLSDYSVQGQKIWLHLVPAVRRIKRSLISQSSTNINVSTSLAMDVLETTFPLSSGAFRSGIRDTVVKTKRKQWERRKKDLPA